MLKKDTVGGAWVAQSVEPPTSAQVMISQLVSSSPALGSVLTAQSLEPTSDSVSPSPSALPLLTLCLSLSLKNKHIIKKLKWKANISIGDSFRQSGLRTTDLLSLTDQNQLIGTVGLFGDNDSKWE